MRIYKLVCVTLVLAVLEENVHGQCPLGSLPDGSSTECFPSQATDYTNRCRPGSFCAEGAMNEPGRCCMYDRVANSPLVRVQTRIRPQCPPVCAIWCENGNVIINGCPVCQCKPDPVALADAVSGYRAEYLPLPVPDPCPAGTYGEGRTVLCQSPGRRGSNLQCPPDCVCVGVGTSRPGHCCRRIAKLAHCPIDISTPTCTVKTDTCDGNRPCPSGLKCCPRICGYRCVPIGTFRVFP